MAAFLWLGVVVAWWSKLCPKKSGQIGVLVPEVAAEVENGGVTAEETFVHPVIELCNAETGKAAAGALGNDIRWRHRKVDSVQLMEGLVGRRRLSMDLIVPPAWALAFDEVDRSHRNLDKVAGLVMAPIAQLRKGPVRDFDLRLADGSSAAVLTRDDNIEVVTGAILSAMVNEGETDVDGRLREIFEDKELVHQVRQIVSARDAKLALAQVDVFCNERKTSGWEVNDTCRAMLRDFARNFLLVALVPKDLVGIRTVVKFAHHWQATVRVWRSIGAQLFASAGFAPFRLQIEMSGPADAASYHLQVHVPHGLISDGLLLPYESDSGVSNVDGEGASPRSGTAAANQEVAGVAAKSGEDASESERSETPEPIDRQVGAVAHVVGAYAVAPTNNQAQLLLGVPGSGLRTVAMVTCLFTSAVFILERVLPGAQVTLLGAADGSAALLLALPAAIVALLARPGENYIVASILAPLRVIIVLCAMLLTAAGWSLVGRLNTPWIDVFWTVGAWASALMLGFLSLGQIVSLVRHTGEEGRSAP